MRLPLWQIDAFAERRFAGNPAAVVELTRWLPDGTLQAIAAENNLSETAFFIDEGTGEVRLRFFTPTVEVDLCGHATLSTAFVLMYVLGRRREVTFATDAGPLATHRDDEGRVWMSLPRRPALGEDAPAGLPAALGVVPRFFGRAAKSLVLLDDEDAVAAAAPDLAWVAAQGDGGLILTAPCARPGVDFVSRFFAPGHGIDEDPVTGSAHCTLVPFWAERLGRRALCAEQISARRGTLWLRDQPDEGRVEVAGRAVLVVEGHLLVDEPTLDEGGPRG